MKPRNCYTYLLEWKDGSKYYGCRYAKGCDPTDLWKTYFTSSTYIPKEDPVKIRIMRVFGDNVKKCRSWESKFLKRVGAVKSEKWHNRSDNDNFYNDKRHTQKTIEKIKLKRSKQILTKERNEKVSKSLTGRKLSEEHRKKISIATKGRIGGRLGKTASKETKEKMSKALKGKPSAAKNTFWWTNELTGERKRSSTKPSSNWKKGMK